MGRESTFTNDAGRNWAVRIVNKGDRYGRDDCLTHDKDEPMVEFYDLTYTEKFGPRGQFVSRYYRNTLTDGCSGYGIDLDGGVPYWSMDGATLIEIVKWANEG
jgi:hypothetical protein